MNLPSYNQLLLWAEHHPQDIRHVMVSDRYNAGIRRLALEAITEKKLSCAYVPQILGAIRDDHPSTQEAGVYALQALILELFGILDGVANNHLLHKGVQEAADEAIEALLEKLP